MLCEACALRGGIFLVAHCQGTMTHKYFGTDGIRGRANAVITADLALRIGQATGLISPAASTAIGW